MEKSEEKIINQLTSEFNLQFLSSPVTEKRQQAL